LLGSLDARRHVNKMCMAARVPLVESGTAGYLGQVQPLLKVRVACEVSGFPLECHIEYPFAGYDGML